MPKEKILLHMKKVVLAKDHPAIVDVLATIPSADVAGFHWFFRSRLRRDGGSRRGFPASELTLAIATAAAALSAPA